VNVLCLLLQAATLILFARIILEWIPVSPDHPVARLRSTLRLVTEPILAPVRRLIPPVRAGGMALDLTPLIVILLLSLIAARVC
jgi:YggT family protein